MRGVREGTQSLPNYKYTGGGGEGRREARGHCTKTNDQTKLLRSPNTYLWRRGFAGLNLSLWELGKAAAHCISRGRKGLHRALT